MMFLMSVPGGTLALLRDNPGVKKGGGVGTGQGKDFKLAALCRTALEAASGRVPLQTSLARNRRCALG